ncbi:MAG TPA: MEDS domain-containing protein [Mycobacteriales bacterium]|nr:MEDS domain-containing protein [Mycobacteriales bacterium]
MATEVQEVAPQAHTVSFYDDDRHLVADVARFVADGLTHGERVVVVATAEHRAAIDDVLVQFGTDAMRAHIHGRFIALDAGELLRTFMVDGAPDPARFVAHVGSVIDAAAEDGCGVRVFGEMVALLWQAGGEPEAIALEALWNELAQSRRFSLLCAYPTQVFSETALPGINRVCELHSEVMAPRSYTAAAFDTTPADPPVVARTSQLFVPVPSAVRAARLFAGDVLRSWGEDAVLGDARAIVSELATNAVAHASSAFQIRLARADQVLRISVEDVGPAQPQRREPSPEDLNGRGMLLVESLALRWGCEATAAGKSVWAELPSRPG